MSRRNGLSFLGRKVGRIGSAMTVNSNGGRGNSRESPGTFDGGSVTHTNTRFAGNIREIQSIASFGIERISLEGACERKST